MLFELALETEWDTGWIRATVSPQNLEAYSRIEVYTLRACVNK